MAAFDPGERLAGDADGIGDVLLGGATLRAGVLDHAGEVRGGLQVHGGRPICSKNATWPECYKKLTQQRC